MTLISRDPFARQEVHRTREYVTFSECSWCGGVNRTPGGRKYLYAYRVETDGGSQSNIKGLFCSIGCMRYENHPSFRCYDGRGNLAIFVDTPAKEPMCGWCRV